MSKLESGISQPLISKSKKASWLTNLTISMVMFTSLLNVNNLIAQDTGIPPFKLDVPADTIIPNILKRTPPGRYDPDPLGNRRKANPYVEYLYRGIGGYQKQFSIDDDLLKKEGREAIEKIKKSLEKNPLDPELQLQLKLAEKKLINELNKSRRELNELTKKQLEENYEKIKETLPEDLRPAFEKAYKQIKKNYQTLFLNEVDLKNLYDRIEEKTKDCGCNTQVKDLIQ